MYRTALWLSLGLLAACTPENQLVEAPAADSFLRLVGPDEGDFLPVGATLVTGEAEGIERIVVNDVEARLEDSHFAAFVELPRGVTVLEARGTDTAGDDRFERRAVMAGTWGDERELVREAAVVRISPLGLQALFTAASDFLDDELLAGLVAEGPLYDGSLSVLGWEAARLKVEIHTLGFDRLSAQADASDSALTLGLLVPNLSLGISASGHAVGLDFDLEPTLRTTELGVVGDLTVDSHDGRLQVDMGSMDVTLGTMSLSPSLTGDETADEVILGLLSRVSEEVLAIVLPRVLPRVMEDRLGQLAVGIEANILGQSVLFNGEFGHADVDAQGIELGVDLGIDMSDAAYALGPGYLLALPEAPALDPQAHIAAAVADDVVNLALYQGWAAGLLDLDLSTEDGSLPEIALASLRAHQGSLRVRTPMPPVLVERNGLLQLQVGGIELGISTPDGEFGTEVQASVSVFVEAAAVVHDGVLGLELGEAEMLVQVHHSDWDGTNEEISSMLEHLLPIGLVADFAAGLEVTLPGLAGIAVDEARVGRDSSGSYTALRLDLATAE